MRPRRCNPAYCCAALVVVASNHAKHRWQAEVGQTGVRGGWRDLYDSRFRIDRRGADATDRTIVAYDDSRSLVNNLLSGGFRLIGIAGVVDDAKREPLPEQTAFGINLTDGASDAGCVFDTVRRFRSGHRPDNSDFLVGLGR
ncbi:protein of unknown function [Pararobbsia alpina]